MTVATLRREVGKLREALRTRTAPPNPTLTRLRRDPALTLALAGFPPDPWQRDFLGCRSPRVLLNCSRQAGKSRVSAAAALWTALVRGPALVLILSPTDRQSGETFLKVLELYRALGQPVPAKRLLEHDFTLELANGSRVVGLPGKEGTIRCFSSVALLVIDEAARVPDGLYRAVRPMLSVSRGRLVALSTPFGRQGWFYDEWVLDPAPWAVGEWCRQQGAWRRYRVPAGQCPRIARDFLEEERKALGERWFLQEYGCQFMDMTGAVFSGEEIDRLFALPLGGGAPFPN
jgi:hypothetical protein